MKKRWVSLREGSPFAIGVDDEGQVERDKEKEHQSCWLSQFCTLELKAPVGVGGCTMERKVRCDGAWVSVRRDLL